MNRVTILFVTDVFVKLAGAERNLFEVVTRLNPQKFRPIVICLNGGSPVELLKQRGIQVVDLKLKRIYSPFVFFKSLQIINFIKSNNVKIVVTYHEGSDLLFSILSKLAQVPLLISSRRDMGYKLKARHVFAYKLLNSLFDKILTVSDAVKNEIFRREGAPWSKLVTVYNGVDVEKFRGSVDKAKIKHSLGLEDGCAVIGILAAIRPIKGHRYFIEAASFIIKEFPKTYFLIVGWQDGNEEYLRELKSFAKELNIEKNVLFTGGRSDTAEILSIMDISVLSSINEGFPNAVLESMAAGKPVVATKSGGTAEAVIEGKTGFLVNPCDSVGLANAILKLLHNDKLSQEMGKNGRDCVEKKFSINRMISCIESLYDELIFEKLVSKAGASERHLNWESLRMTFLKIIKLSLSSVFYHTGMAFFVRKKVSGKNKLLILAYHRINNNSFDPLWMNINSRNFEEHLRFIKKNYNPVSLEHVVKLMQNKEDIPEGTIAITFDDGYQDNYTNAFSLLCKYAIPATIFLSVDSINKKTMLWYDKIIDAFKNTSKKQVSIKTGCLNNYLLDSEYKKSIAAREIVTYAKFLNKPERDKFIIYLFNVLNISSNDQESDNRMLTWEEIKTMSNSGLSFGNHGMSHSVLAKLTNDDLNQEIAESKSIIKEETGIETELFAFPYGGEADFSDMVQDVLKENHYIAACTLLSGLNTLNSNLFRLKRNCVTKGMEAGLFGKFSKTLFTTKNLGIFDNLAKLIA